MLDGIIASSVPNILGAIVGAIGLVTGVWLTARYTKNLDVKKHREGLASDAFSDFLRAMAQSAFAREEGERLEALVLAAHAKARLVTYGDASLVREIRRFDDGGADATKPACQAAIVAAAQGLRSSNETPGTLSDEEIRNVLFGDV